MSKQKLVYLTITLFTLLLSGLFLRALPFSRAQTTPSVSLTTNQPSYQPGDTITVSVEVESVEGLGGYQFTLGFNSSLVTYESISDGDFLSSTGRTAIPLTPDIQDNHLIFGVATLGSQPPGPSGNGTLASVVFTANTHGSLSLSLTNVILSDISGTQIPASTITPLEVTIADSTEPTPTPTPPTGPSPTPITDPSLTPTPTPTTNPTPAPEGTATLSLVSSTPNPLTDTPFSIDLNLATSTLVSGVDVILEYDPRRLRIDSLNDHQLLPHTAQLEDNPGSGVIRFSALADPGQALNPSGTLLTLNVTPLSAGPLGVTFDYTPGSKADTNVIAAATGNDILETPHPLNLEVLDQAFISVSLTTPSENIAVGHQITGTVSTQDNSFSTGITTNSQGQGDPILAPSSLIGQLTSFFFKASGFLKAKVDTTLLSGQNQLEFGHLKAGDLNDDGIINTIDLSILYDSWFSRSDPMDHHHPADFNRDGIVNSADHWHLWNNYLLEDAE